MYARMSVSLSSFDVLGLTLGLKEERIERSRNLIGGIAPFPEVSQLHVNRCSIYTPKYGVLISYQWGGGGLDRY